MSNAAGLQVDTTADTNDTIPGDGNCSDENGDCSLRGAIQESNALPGVDQITVPAGVYSLSRVGLGEDASETGDLDILDDVIIEGAGPSQTILDGLYRDRVFEIGPVGVNAKFSGLTVQRGGEDDPDFCYEGLAFRSGFGTNVELVNLDVHHHQKACDTSAILLNGNTTISRSNIHHNEGPAVVNRLGHLTILDSVVADNQGTGIVSPAPLIAERIRVERNHGFVLGGGIEAANSVELRDSFLSYNDAAHGGGVSLFQGVLERVVVVGNSALHGGGVYARDSVVIIDSEVVDNHAGATGGGITNFGDLQIERSTIARNDAGTSGGGVHSFGQLAVIEMTNATVSDNTADDSGGGLNLESGSNELVGVTIADNRADADDDGFGQGGGTRTNSAQLTGTGVILANNRGTAGSLQDCGGNFTSGGFSLIRQLAGCTYSPAPGDIVNADPQLLPLERYGGRTPTRALNVQSPAVDQWGSCPPPDTDQRDVARPFDGDGDHTPTCDIGAYELVGPPHVAVGGVVEIFNRDQAQVSGQGVTLLALGLTFLLVGIVGVASYGRSSRR